MGDNIVIEARRMTAIPINFTTKPTLIISMILTLPLENIIALGGVAKKYRNYFRA
jgi:hypothetical protein